MASFFRFEQRSCSDEGWMGANSNSCYYVSLDVRSWVESKAACEDLGAHLVTITGALEMELVIDIAKTKLGQQESATDLMNYFVWMGGESIHGSLPKTWSWITGETWGYTHWGADEPDGHLVEYCLGMYPMDAAYPMWVDYMCDNTLLYICEKDAIKTKVLTAVSITIVFSGSKKLNTVTTVLTDTLPA